MKELNWKPAILIADDGGFNDPAFVKQMGSGPEGLISRSVFAQGKPGSVAAMMDALYKKKTGGDGLDDVSARGLQGFFVLADAINRAGSTEPAKVQAALKATDLKPDQLVAGYDGVKFDAQGPEHAGLDPGDAAQEQQLRRRLAEGPRHRSARPALQGLVVRAGLAIPARGFAGCR